MARLAPHLAPHLAACLAALTIFATAPTASACDFVPGFVPPPDQTGLHWGIAIAAVTTVDVAVVAGQLALNEELFPDWLAAIELGLGIAQSVSAVSIAGYGVFSGTDSCGGDPWQRYGTWSAVAMAFTGGWLIAHAMWSLAAPDLPDVTASVAVSPEGATLAVVGTF